MLIGELSKKKGFSRDTIRYYEKLGLIEVKRKERRDNNYKEYNEAVLTQLQSIHRLKDMGFTLSEISGLLDKMEVNEASCDYVAELVKQKAALIDRKITELQQLKEKMQQQVACCCTPKFVNIGVLQNCPIL